MNKVVLMGRLTKDPEVKYTQGTNPIAVARYSLAVNRKVSREGEQAADFINCVCFGRLAEFANKYLQKGTKLLVEGRIQTGSYTNKEGQKVYTFDVVVESQEFAESKSSQSGQAASGRGYPGTAGQGHTSPSGQGYTAPGQGYAAPGQGYTAPGQGYAAPGQGYTAPGQGYTAPGQGYAAPGQGYATPDQGYATSDQGFMNIPDGLDDELPFN